MTLELEKSEIISLIKDTSVSHNDRMQYQKEGIMHFKSSGEWCCNYGKLLNMNEQEVYFTGLFDIFTKHREKHD